MADPAPSPTDTPIAGEDPFKGTQYRLCRSLARGGMGHVYLVEHRTLGRQFVAKLVHQRLAADAQLVDRFRLEAQTLGRLNHPNIVSIFGFGTTHDNRPFMVTEYLRGRTLAQEIASGSVIPLREAVRYGHEIVSALAAAHDVGVVHRDIKPENLFIQEMPGGGTHIKVLDFGLARVLPCASHEAPPPLEVPTDTGVVFGTPRFMSPEAALGKHVDHRADIYSAGLVLYLMLAGRGPFDHVQGHTELMTAHLIENVPAPSSYARVPVPPELDALVLRALAKEPDDRIQNAHEFERLLAEVSKRFQRASDSQRPVSGMVPISNAARAINADSVETLPGSIGASAAGRNRRLRSFLFFLLIMLGTTFVVVLAGQLIRGNLGAP